MVYGGEAAAMHAAAMARATKAMGAIVKMEPQEFLKVLAKVDAPLVVTGTKGFFTKKNQYLTSYRGVFFYAESVPALTLPFKAEVVAAGNIWVPNM